MQINTHIIKIQEDGTTVNFSFVADGVAEARNTTDALLDAQVPADAPTPAQKAIADALADAKADKEKKAPKPDAKAASSPSGAKPQSAAPKGDAPAAAVEYATVKARILAVAQKSRDMTAAMLATFKDAEGAAVKNGTQLAPEQYADLVTLADKVLAGELDLEALQAMAETADDMA